MKPKFQRKAGGRGKQSRDKLHEFMVSVHNLIRTEGGNDQEESHGLQEMLAKRKSRKEMRREKRKLKKKKKKTKQPAEESGAGGSVEAAPEEPPEKPSQKPTENKKPPQKPPENKKPPSAMKDKTQWTCPEDELRDKEPKPKRKVHFENTAPQPEKKAKLHTMRMKALMEANEVEDREIKKLEKRLGLHKRKNKKSLPQSFVSDGLDYILGLLEPGGSGLYDSDEEEESAGAKSHLGKLEELGEDEEDGELETKGRAEEDNEDDGDEENEDEDLEMSGYAEDDGEEEEDDEDEEMEEEEEVEGDGDGDDASEEGDEQDDENEESSRDRSSVSQYRIQVAGVWVTDEPFPGH